MAIQNRRNNVVHFPFDGNTCNERKLLKDDAVLKEEFSSLSNRILSIESSSSNKEEEYIRDVQILPRQVLRRKYKLTYDSWRNMKLRRKLGAIIDPAYEDFASFLLSMGPRPNSKYTLDRKDPANPVYGPGLCEWRDKHDQANNRTSTIYLTNENNECLPLTKWAKKLKIRPDTLRKRKANGWSDQEIISGKRTHKPAKEEVLDSLECPWWGSNKQKYRLEKEYQINKETYRSRHDYALHIIDAHLREYVIASKLREYAVSSSNYYCADMPEDRKSEENCDEYKELLALYRRLANELNVASINQEDYMSEEEKIHRYLKSQFADYS